MEVPSASGSALAAAANAARSASTSPDSIARTALDFAGVAIATRAPAPRGCECERGTPIFGVSRDDRGTGTAPDPRRARSGPDRPARRSAALLVPSIPRALEPVAPRVARLRAPVGAKDARPPAPPRRARGAVGASWRGGSGTLVPRRIRETMASKAEYLKRYLSGAGDDAAGARGDAGEKKKRRRKKDRDAPLGRAPPRREGQAGGRGCARRRQRRRRLEARARTPTPRADATRRRPSSSPRTGARPCRGRRTAAAPRRPYLGIGEDGERIGGGGRRRRARRTARRRSPAAETTSRRRGSGARGTTPTATTTRARSHRRSRGPVARRGEGQARQQRRRGRRRRPIPIPIPVPRGTIEKTRRRLGPRRRGGPLAAAPRPNTRRSRLPPRPVSAEAPRRGKGDRLFRGRRRPFPAEKKGTRRRDGGLSSASLGRRRPLAAPARRAHDDGRHAHGPRRRLRGRPRGGGAARGRHASRRGDVRRGVRRGAATRVRDKATGAALSDAEARRRRDALERKGRWAGRARSPRGPGASRRPGLRCKARRI